MGTLKAALTNSANVGDINGTGDFTAKKVGVFAALVAVEGSEPEIDIESGDENDYFPVPGTFSNDPIEGFGAATVSTPGIKYTHSKTQYFEIDWHATVSSSASGTNIHCSVLKNGAIIDVSDKGRMGTRAKNSNQPYNISGTVAVELEEDDEIQLVVESDKITTLKIYHYTTTISEFFD